MWRCREVREGGVRHPKQTQKLVWYVQGPRKANSAVSCHCKPKEEHAVVVARLDWGTKYSPPMSQECRSLEDKQKARAFYTTRQIQWLTSTSGHGATIPDSRIPSL